LGNRVGGGVVAPMTHTPASGPFALVTVPPMSSGSIAIVAPPRCCAFSQVNEAISTLVTASTLGFTRALMCSSSCGIRNLEFWSAGHEFQILNSKIPDCAVHSKSARDQIQ